MVALPLIEEVVSKDGGMALTALAQGVTEDDTPSVSRLSAGDRRFLIYPPNAGFDILPDIDAVSDFAVEPSIFFTPRFCVPALPRLADKQVQLMILRDGDVSEGNTRFLMPFTVEKPGFSIGPDAIRAWVSPYGPFGVPIVERREAHQIVDDLYATLGQRSVNLPKILVLPDVPRLSPVVSLMRSVALATGLPVAETDPIKRPVLDATQDSEDYFHEVLSGHHRRNYARLRRQLAESGELSYTIARNPEEVRLAMEEFLLLENQGWKGKKGTSLTGDRYRAAFAREAVNNLAARDKCRIHALTLDGKVIASLIVFVEGGKAWTWKTTYDETLRNYSPGTLLMMQVTENLLDDPNVLFADSCAVPDHSVMSRLWTKTEDMVTLIVGLSPEKDRDVRQVASQIALYSSTREIAKSIQARLRDLAKRL